MNKHTLLRRPVLSWALYDWGNSAFATTVMAGFFPVFYGALSRDLDAADSQFWFTLTLAASSILVAASAPLLGAIADRGGNRKRFLATFATLGVVMTAGLAWVHAGGPLVRANLPVRTLHVYGRKWDLAPKSIETTY